ncbi:EF-hand domain-containing protein [Streptomyces sp. TLI_185]|uniref:EF-hand domain-containing protein n=1 Tax=Streptomyces sp. TLI_185 TaxID=2485151 RepID=UPI000F4F9E93|nr:EF-hand domain-containing protein [Streptomyces sp. TLI_185]RPF38321.1 EF hand domain-containing protein [Streptomyces sp. TLI_185]
MARTRSVALAMGLKDDDQFVVTARTLDERAWASMDADGDGKMTFDEYTAWVGAEAFDTVCAPVLAALFDLADTNHDGALDLREFTALRTALNNPATNAETAFTALDTDGDGRISRDDYIASIRAHVTGESSPMGRALYSSPLSDIPA